MAAENALSAAGIVSAFLESVQLGSPAERRQQMVDEQLRGRGVRDPRVLAAMLKVARQRFVPSDMDYLAYSDTPLPIGFSQTISQPLMVALMLEALELTGSERVLEVGTGSGYQAALLAELAREVYTVEIVPELAARARTTLAELGYASVRVIASDGSVGYAAAAPYDAIVVAAASPELPAPLTDQLAEGGRLVIPVGNRLEQQLLRATKRAGELHVEDLGACAFVPLLGEHGWVDGRWRRLFKDRP